MGSVWPSPSIHISIVFCLGGKKRRRAIDSRQNFFARFARGSLVGFWYVGDEKMSIFLVGSLRFANCTRSGVLRPPPRMKSLSVCETLCLCERFAGPRCSAGEIRPKKGRARESKRWGRRWRETPAPPQNFFARSARGMPSSTSLLLRDAVPCSAEENWLRRTDAFTQQFGERAKGETLVLIFSKSLENIAGRHKTKADAGGTCIFFFLLLTRNIIFYPTILSGSLHIFSLPPTPSTKLIYPQPDQQLMEVGRLLSEMQREGSRTIYVLNSKKYRPTTFDLWYKRSG